MSNRRFILFFLIGSVLLSCLLWFLSFRARRTASVDTRSVLCTFAPEDVDAVEIVRPPAPTLVFSRREPNTWFLTSPFPAETESSAVARLLDAFTQTPLGDMLSDTELGSIGRRLSDFGLAPPRACVTLRSRGRVSVVRLGAFTPSHTEVYARAEELRNVFTVPASVAAAVPDAPDVFRRRTLLACGPEEISGIEFRTPGSPFVKLSDDGSGWKFVQPLPSPADASAVAQLLGRLTAAKAVSFEWPSFSAAASADNGGGKIGAARLAGYGLDPETSFSVTVRTVSGGFGQIVFGGVAGTNLVYALAQGGSAVVTVRAELAESCRTASASLRDTRVFPLAADETVRSLSLTAGGLIYVLSKGTNQFWTLSSPALAPADQIVASALAEKILSLRQKDLQSPPADNAVRVAVTTSVTNRSGVAVSPSFFGPASAFADLRAKTLLTLDVAAIRRISLTPASGPSVSVILDPVRGVWNLERSSGLSSTAHVNPEAVKKLLTALVDVRAVGVETLAASPDDFRRCGLDAPAFTLAVDVSSDDAVRKNILLGQTAPGGGRYATAGGMDAVFIVSRATVAALTASLTESDSGQEDAGQKEGAIK